MCVGVCLCVYNYIVEFFNHSPLSSSGVELAFRTIKFCKLSQANDMTSCSLGATLLAFCADDGKGTSFKWFALANEFSSRDKGPKCGLLQAT